MSSYYPDALVEEWEAIRQRAAPGARILLRSAHARPAYLDSIRIGPERQPLREAFRFMDDVADALQPQDRVHTYAGFVIADVPA
jgi:S-adenosylmethionine-diacylglycerol 3-amino-3-carboxypropyl transferase